MKKALSMLAIALVCVFLVGVGSELAGRQSSASNFIEGVVLNSNGHSPEAGVWVIAETRSLPTPFRKIVVTNDDGKFVVPDLPNAEYKVWVRGYGLKDSEPVQGAIGKPLTLQVSSAANPQEAAKVYPANYWTSLYQPPILDVLPKRFKSQDQWVAQFKLGCDLCHVDGIPQVRGNTSPAQFDAYWHLAGVMNATANGLGRDVLAKSMADWGTRIAAGEVPPAPPRPAGIERNVVLTEWEWGEVNGYFHDLISTDKRNPSLYPNGRIYGLDIGRDFVWTLDPKTNTVASFHVPVAQEGYDKEASFASWTAYHRVATPHNPTMDGEGRVWITQVIRDQDAAHYPKWADKVTVYTGGMTPSKCGAQQEGASNVSSEGAEANEGSHYRELSYFDTKTNTFTFVDTPFGNHHLQLDSEGRLWTSSDSKGLGMIDTTKFDPKHPEESEIAAEKYYIELDPKTCKAVSGGGYGIAVNPADGTIWRAMPSADGPNNKLNEFDPKTLAFKDWPLPAPGRGPRGLDMTTDGMVWFATGSGHLGRLNPKTGKFTYWELPGPKIKGMGPETGSADFPYYLWVDQFNTLGMGKNIVVATGSSSDALLAFDPATEKWTVVRFPFPMGMHTRGLDGRIDDAKTGWKGRGWWATYSMDPPKFTEGDPIPTMAHVQVRPDPLAH